MNSKDVSLLTDSLNFSGTTGEIEAEVIKDGNTLNVNIGLPDDVTIGGELRVNDNVVFDSTLTISDDLTVSGVVNLPANDPTDDNEATRKKYVDDEIQKISNLSIVGDSGYDTVSLETGKLTITGGTGIISTVADDEVSLGLSDTGVDPGSFGSTTEVPIFTVD